MIPILHKEKSITFKQEVYYAKNKQKNARCWSSIGDNLPLDKLYLEKYDYLLPESILRKSFINSTFDTKHFLKYIDQV